jgi:hypothetical protein
VSEVSPRQLKPHRPACDASCVSVAQTACGSLRHAIAAAPFQLKAAYLLKLLIIKFCIFVVTSERESGTRLSRGGERCHFDTLSSGSVHCGYDTVQSATRPHGGTITVTF